MDFKEIGFEWGQRGLGRCMLEGYCENTKTFSNSMQSKKILGQLNVRQLCRDKLVWIRKTN